MAWSWSHSQEAYAAAEANLRALPLATLEIIFAEWRAAQGKGGIVHDSEVFNQRKYDRALVYAKSLSVPLGPDFAREQLADFIWGKASEAATCDNGGWDAWMCPSGCGCHTVSFSTPEEEDAEEFDQKPENFWTLDPAVYEAQ